MVACGTSTAGFYYDYQDMQQANDLIGNQTVQVIDNVSRRASGRRSRRDHTPDGSIPCLRLRRLSQCEIQRVQQAITGISLDTKLPKTPEWSATAGAEYIQPTSIGEFMGRVDYSWVDAESYADVRNTPSAPARAQPPQCAGRMDVRRRTIHSGRLR
ncbi:MAG: hypothetical protein R3C55_05865 [Parvularculaceae bacterium]